MGSLVSDILPIASTAAGFYTGNPALIAGGLGALGASQQGQAAQQGNQQAAQAAQFRPVGITNTFGTSNFGYDPQGNLSSAGYTLDPRLQGAQNYLMGGLGQNLQDQANIQAMGRQYMAQSPQEQAQQYIANQQALLQPSRDRQLAALGTQNYNQGTTGLSVAQGGTLQAANPYASALFNQMAQQDLALAADATRAGQQQYQFGQGLLSSAYQPYTAGLTAAGATEALGQQPLELSSSLAGRSATAGANAGKYLQAAGSYSPTGSLLSGLAGNTQFNQGIGNLFGTWGQSDIGRMLPKIGGYYDAASQEF
jgi:YD repeat-containing protein